jgi:predicted HicB family RNase H-like nuclease
MKQINVRLPDDVHAKLVALATTERRSLNNMIIALIERLPDPAPSP